MERVRLPYGVCALIKFLSRVFFHARQTLRVGIGSKHICIMICMYYVVESLKKLEL